MAFGKLYVLSGPIGNLADITLRALDTLKSVDFIVSEDTRETSKLLNKYQIEKSQLSYRDQNHNKVVESIVALLKDGKDLALVSDSGTPTISDPGFKLVEQIRSQQIQIVPIPGPTAVISALSVSGLPTDKFTFLGFLPKNKSSRKKVLIAYGALDATLVLYESPFRIKKLLQEIKETLGNRVVCIARELTKIHEEVITGTVEELLAKKIMEKGEFTVLVAKESYKYE